jgi:hypothetical protein
MVAALSLSLEPIQISPGEVIYREGQTDDCMYFLHEGEVELSMLMLTEAQKIEFGAHIQSDPSLMERRSNAQVPQPSTPNPKPSTSSSARSSLNPKPLTLDPKPSTSSSARSSLNPKP